MQTNPITLFLAAITGYGLGLVTPVMMQQVINRQAIEECRENHSRKLITLSTTIGDTRNCVSGGYFADDQ